MNYRRVNGRPWPLHRGALLAAACLFWSLSVGAGGSLDLILVHPDGTVARQSSVLADSPSVRKTPSVRYAFGLPAKPPEAQWQEQESLPICHSRWEQNGIRYTQIVLVTRLGEGDLQPEGEPPADLVILVQLVGENSTNEYTEAKAAFELRREQAALPLDLQEGLVREAGKADSGILGLVDVPAGGVATAAGPQLQFQGNMPPGTSGAMTIKIPLAEIKEARQLDRLRFLDFTEEFQRVKKYWVGRFKQGRPPTVPVAFAGRE